MSRILSGVLQPGARAVGIGISGARRGVAMFDGSPRSVVVKAGVAQELAAECFCALLADALSVRTPPCGIVYENGVALFASIDLQAPNLMQQFCLDASKPGQAELQALVNEMVQWVGLGAPRRFVWNPTFTIAGRSRARWACGQAAFEPVHMSTGLH